MRSNLTYVRYVANGRKRAEGEPLSRDVKRQIIERDDNHCRLCHRRRDLQVHHIDGRGEWRADPNHEETNLITLCRRCHRALHTEGVELNLTLLLAADARRITPHVNLPRTATVNEHLMQPDRALGLLEF